MHHSRLDSVGEFQGLVDILREHRGAETVFGVVGEAQRLFEIVERIERGNRPEGLLGADRHLRSHPGQDRGRADVAAPVAAGEQFRSLGAGILDMAAHPLALARRDDWPHHRLGAAQIAGTDLARCRRIGFGEAVEDRTLDENPRGAHADLTLIHEHAEHGGLDRLVEIRVGADHHRALAAKLERIFFKVTRGDLGDMLADPRRSGKGDRAHQLVAGQRVSDLRAIAVDDVEQAVRHPRLAPQIGEQVGDSRCRFGRKEHEGVAGGQRHRRLFYALDQRHVERRDSGDDADRLAHAHADPSGNVRRDGLAAHPPRDSRGGAQEADREADLEPSFGDRRADLVDQHIVKLRRITLDDRRRLGEPGLARSRRQGAMAFERFMRGFDRTIDVGRIARSRAHIDRIIDRVQIIEIVAARRSHRRAADPMVEPRAGLARLSRFAVDQRRHTFSLPQPAALARADFGQMPILPGDRMPFGSSTSLIR